MHVVQNLRGVQTSLCSLERGLYTFRYTSTPSSPAPSASLRIISGPISFINAPGRTRAELVDKGQCIVLVAEAPGTIEIAVAASPQGGVPEASFALDLLDRGSEPASVAPSGALRPQISENLADEPDDVPFEIEAHVSRIGDVRVSAGMWIAGPDCPLPIEGLTLIESQRVSGLEMQVQSGIGSGAWSPWSGAGHFAGTRQRAEHLTGIRLKLREGAGASRTIIAEALFLGASVVRKEGAFVDFSSRDPLVGLKIDVVQKASAAVAAAPTFGRKIQVFRA